MNGSGLFSQPQAESQGVYEAGEITATQLGSQVDFSFLDFNTQEAAPSYGSASHATQVWAGQRFRDAGGAMPEDPSNFLSRGCIDKRAQDGLLNPVDRLPSGLSLDGVLSETGLSQLSLQATDDEALEGEGLEAAVPEWACAYVQRLAGTGS